MKTDTPKPTQPRARKMWAKCCAERRQSATPETLNRNRCNMKPNTTPEPHGRPTALRCDALVSPSSFMKTEGHKFTFYGGQDIVAGKPHWPHHLRLVMDRQAAFHLVRDVIAQLENDCGADVRLAAVGEIVREAEDDFQWANVASQTAAPKPSQPKS